MRNASRDSGRDPYEALVREQERRDRTQLHARGGPEQPYRLGTGFEPAADGQISGPVRPVGACRIGDERRRVSVHDGRPGRASRTEDLMSTTDESKPLFLPAANAEATPARRYRRRSKDQRVRRFRADLIRVAPHLDDRKFAPLLHSFSRVSLLALDSYEFLRDKGIVGENGELRSSVDTVQRLIGMQLKLANALGLSPSALGKLRHERPIDLAAALAEDVGVVRDG